MVVRLARTLQIELENAEARRSLHDRPRDPDAIDLTMRGLAILNQLATKTSSDEARALFEQALILDPNNADALAGAARIDAVEAAFGSSDKSADLYARAMQRTDQALLLDPSQARAHFTKALLIMFKARANDAASANEIIAESEASLRANPSFPWGYWPMAVGEMLLGHYEQSISELQQAMKISPRDPNIGIWHMEIGRSLLALTRYDAAIQEGLKAINFGVSHGAILCVPRGVLRSGKQGAGGGGRDGGSDEIESKTLCGVVSRAHTCLYRFGAGYA